MRGADTGPWTELCSLPAFWVGLLYDQSALDTAWDFVKDWTEEERWTLRRDVAKTGLQTKFRDKTVQDLAKVVLTICREGLKARGRLNGQGESETIYLQELDGFVRSGKTNADRLLGLYKGGWNGDILQAYTDCRY